MRYVMLDTETTGLSPAKGHRVIEIAAIEVENRAVTSKSYQAYLDPKRPVEPEAFKVHGLSDEFLEGKPTFDLVVDEFLAFVNGSTVVIHNAPFDVGFLNMELGKIGLGTFGDHCHEVIDSLSMARRLHPGRRNSLDALCERYAVDRSSRTLHGALIDTQLLAEVYLAMTRGQDSFLNDDAPRRYTAKIDKSVSISKGQVHVLEASVDELTRHDNYLDRLNHAEEIQPIWKGPDE